jgi:hypothetical protein
MLIGEVRRETWLWQKFSWQYLLFNILLRGIIQATFNDVISKVGQKAALYQSNLDCRHHDNPAQHHP